LAGDTGNAVPLVCGYLLNQHKILTAPVFNHSSVLRLEPPLTISKREIDTLIAALDQTGEALSKANYYELFMHVVGEPEQSSKKFIRHLDFSKTQPSVEPPRKDETQIGKFAFLIHPTEFKDLVSCQPPAFELFNEAQQNNWQRWLKSWCSQRYEPGVVFHMPAFRSKQGGYVQGWLIGCPLTPDQMMRLPLKERKKLVQDFIRIAKRLGVDMLGLGAFTSVITRAGSDIADCGINITTGNSLTAMASAESLLLAARKKSIDVAKATTGVVGAAGSVGRLVCKRLVSEVGGMILFGNPSNPKSTQKLEQLAGELYCSALVGLNNGRHPGIAQRLLTLKSQAFWEDYLQKSCQLSSQQSAKSGSLDYASIYRFINRQFDQAKQEPALRTTVDMERHLPNSQLLVSATSQGAAFIDPAQLAEHAVVCDAARPPDVRKDVNNRRKNILVYEGGLLNLPQKIRFGKDNVIGFPDGINLACLSETITLAFTNPIRNFSIGMDVPLEEAQFIYQTALSHGFEIALLDSDGEVAGEAQHLEQVSTL
jgi:predicted amino acid dehydrogenase